MESSMSYCEYKQNITRNNIRRVVENGNRSIQFVKSMTRETMSTANTLSKSSNWSPETFDLVRRFDRFFLIKLK